MKTLAILLAVLFSIGCSPPMLRGEFSLLAIERPEKEITVLSETPITGKACYNMAKAAFFVGEGVFDQAVSDALSTFSGATMLVDAEFTDTGSCVEATGLPARF